MKENRNESNYRSNQHSEKNNETDDHLKNRIKLIETILHNIPVGIAVNSIGEGSLLFMNEEYSGIFGWPGDDLTNLEHFFYKVYADDKYPGDAVKQFLKEIQSREQRRMDWEGIEIKTAAGERRFVDITNIPVKNQNLMISLVRDVTEQKQNQQKIEENGHKLNETVNLLEKTLTGISDAVMVINPENRTVILANPAVEKIFGYKPDEIMGRNTKFLHVNTETYEKFGHISEAELEKSDHFFTEYEMRKKDGSIINTENTVNGIYDERGWRTGVVSIVRDITELKQSRMQLKSITDNLPGAVIQYTRKSDGTDALTYVSEGAGRIWGVTARQAMENNKLIWDQIDRRDIEKVVASIQNSAENLSPWSIEFRNHHPDYTLKWLHGLGLPHKQADGSIVWNSLMLDITRRKEAEEEICKYQQSLRDLTTEISLIEEKQRKEIASNIHDNLSQLLVIAKMKLSDLQNTLQNEPNEKKLRAAMGYISEAIENSRNITYDLSPPVLYELGLIEAVNWLTEKIKQKHNLQIDLKTELEELPLSESKLIIVYRVIQELFNNIIKHAHAGYACIVLKKAKNGVEIRISDNGKGFLPDKSAVPGNMKRGFGLFTVKERIQNISGEIAINSAPGKGTTITLFIPANDL